MDWFEYVLIITLVIFVGVVFFFHFRNEFKGKGCDSCSGNCKNCSKGTCLNCKKLVEEYHKQEEQSKNVNL